MTGLQRHMTSDWLQEMGWADEFRNPVVPPEWKTPALSERLVAP
ncbi:hypothetical protein [Actinomadura sp. NTSP31]